MTGSLTPLLLAGEGYHTEFKQSLDKSFVEEACAFANSGGGRILLGVADSGVIKGIDTGISRIRQTVAEHGCTELELRFNDFFTATFRSKTQVAQDVTGEVSEQVNEQVSEQDKAHDEANELTDTERKILGACREATRSAPDLLEVLGYRTRTGNFKKAMSRLCDVLKLLEPMLPDSARSKNQKYRLTDKGREILRQEGSDE